jgi:hypothetical protein
VFDFTQETKYNKPYSYKYKTEVTFVARVSRFSPEELIVREQVPAMFGPPVNVYTTPITSRENTLLLYHGKTPM